jgi:sterol desaturase/sphingolipid hydroxylase (fatty acid hydroxylase superfamily)
MPDWLYLALSLGGFGTLLGLELRSASFRAGLYGKKRRRVRRNLQFLTAALLVSWSLRFVWSELFVHVPPLFDWRGHWLANLFACFLIADLIGWGLHYIKHKSRFLWKLHFQHHIEPRFDLWLVTHTHPFEVLISGTAMGVALVALGFSPVSVETYLLFYSLANTYQHSAFDYSLGWLDKLIVSPAYHRLHHVVGSDTNFGDTLTIWDLVFSTATWPRRERNTNAPVGIPPGPEPYGFAAELVYFTDSEPDVQWAPEPTTVTMPVYVP